jgi:thiol-disulfide isomerase/thioredoxin
MTRIKTYEQTIKAIQSSIAIIVAKTQGCNVCLPVTLRLIELMKDYPNIPLYEVYIEDVPEFRGQHLVFTVPTIIVFNEGREIHRESRFIDWHKLIDLLEKIK